MKTLPLVLFTTFIALFSLHCSSQVERVDVKKGSSTSKGDTITKHSIMPVDSNAANFTFSSDFDYRKTPKNAIKFSVSDVAFGLFGFRYERLITDRFAIEAGFAAIMPYYKYSNVFDFFKNDGGGSDYIVNPSGFNLSVQFTFNNSEELGYFFYGSIPYRYQYLQVDGYIIKTHSVAYLWGKQFNLWTPNLFIDLSGGVGLMYKTYQPDPNYEDNFMFFFPIDISLGYTF